MTSHEGMKTTIAATWRRLGMKYIAQLAPTVSTIFPFG